VDISERIINRYIHIFYPANINWLKCNKVWNIKLCRCIDEFELNIAVLLFNAVIGNGITNVIFHFREDVDNKTYYMKVKNKNIDLNSFPFCKYTEELKLVNCRETLVFNESFDGGKELDAIVDYDESIITYISLCLLKVNRDTKFNRNDILKYYFLKNPQGFSKYLCDFYEFINTASKLNEDFLDFHIKLIGSILEFHSSDLDSNILGDVCDAFDEQFFKENYKCENNLNIIKKLFLQSVSKYEISKLPVLNIKIPQRNVTIISLMTNVAKIIKKKSNWDNQKSEMNSIKNHLEAIIKAQRRTKEKQIKTDMEELQLLLQQ